MKRIILILTICCCLPGVGMAQTEQEPEEETYYIGINPVAPFTGIRSEFTSLYLPIIANQEAGTSVFVGKIMNRHYNLETRASYGSPLHAYMLLQVQSGLSYCFTTNKKQWHPYAGLFVNIYSLENKETAPDVDYASLRMLMAVGNRFIWKRYFLDLRLNEYLSALSWTNEDGGKAMWGFHKSLYKWHSPYVPYIAVNIGYMFK